MATKEFILQGFTTRTHAAVVRELFDVSDIQQVIVSVAFITESGVEQIETQLKAEAKHATVLAGIRNDLTSYQGLLRLHNLGVKLYTVDTGSRTVIFHPKLYLVRGKQRACLLVGSANLTLGGLNNNIEAGMFLDFDLGVKADRDVVDEIETQLLALPKDYSDNVVRVAAVGDIDKQLLAGRLVDEMAVPPPRPVTIAGSSKGDTVPRIKLKVIPLRRTLQRVTATPQKAKSPILSTRKIQPLPVTCPIVGVELELVWESKTLTRRDLTIPSAQGTHATGSINLDKGQLPASVDHRHYFRNDVFPHLTWSHRSRTVDATTATFKLVIKGISYGEFDLFIAHTTSTTSKAYMQKNAMTRLSWGPIRKYIAEPSLIGRTLLLYRDKADPKRFILEID